MPVSELGTAQPQLVSIFLISISVRTKICVKKDDQVVSRQIAEEGAWEEDNVVLVLKAMSFLSRCCLYW